MGAVNERAIDRPTTTGAAWTRWLAEEPPLAIALDELLQSSDRLIVVAPHPDDEVLACGGLLHLHAARGGSCVVLAATDGEASHGRASDAERQALAATRRAERESGLSLLGLPSTRVMRLGLPDGALTAHAAALERALERIVRAEDTVVSTWVLDGHPDHEGAGHLSQRAAARARARFISAPVWMWHWSYPQDRHVPWHVLRALRLPRDTVQRKQGALAAHQTQLAPRDAGLGPVLDSEIQQRAGWAMEYYFV